MPHPEIKKSFEINESNLPLLLRSGFLRGVLRENAGGNESQTIEGVDANVLRATRLMRLFNEQVETMMRLKRKGDQRRVVVAQRIDDRLP